MLSNLIRFTIIAVIGIISVMLILGIVGVLNSDYIWNSVTKVVEIAVVILVASALILIASKK